jgi:hypothetical protein
MAENSGTGRRPFLITILAGLAGIAAVLSIIHLLQALGIFPYVIGQVQFRDFNFWYALMWGLMVWVYVWLMQMLWQVNPAAWLFLVVITIFNLVIAFTALIGSTTWSDVSVSVILNALILGYCCLPGVRAAFGQR